VNYYQLYHFARKNKLLMRVFKNSLFQTIKDRLLRIKGIPRLRGDNIKWHNYSFYFIAPYKTFYTAKNRGIENQICRLLHNNIRKSDTFLDVGANYGFITLVLSQKASKVFSYELIPFISETLKKTININNLSNKIIVENKAISDISNDILQIKIGANHFQIPSLRIDDYVGLEYVGAIKIDIDGDDYKVLIGASKTIKKWHPIIVIELNKKPEFIYDFLLKHGYNHFFATNGQIVKIGDDSIPNLVASTRALEFHSYLK
jgi:FkbM family methyltransferase